MILKILSVCFAVLFVLRILFARRLKAMGRIADQMANLFLIAIALYLLLQSAIFYSN